MNQSQITRYKQCMRAFNWHTQRKGNVINASYTAYAILGVEVEIKKLTTLQKVKGCDNENGSNEQHR